jgi:hypothetical protein
MAHAVERRGDRAARGTARRRRVAAARHEGWAGEDDKGG